jgi:hypothetical protein
MAISVFGALAWTGTDASRQRLHLQHMAAVLATSWEVRQCGQSTRIMLFSCS